MTVVGIVSPGHMGAGLGHDLRDGGARVVATVAGRSARTARLAAGLELLADLDAVVAAADVLLVVTPPGEALAAAQAIAAAAARTDAHPLVADMNAVAPTTVDDIAAALDGLEFVDGSISGAPPTLRPGARLYLSGPAAGQVAALPWQAAKPIVVGPRTGSASAVKMCTASVYKGMVGLFSHAMVTAHAHDVLDTVLADLARTMAPQDAATSVAVAATKADRYVPEMLQIAATQAAAGLTPALFEGFAAAYAAIARGELAAGDPETVDVTMPPAQVAARLLRSADTHGTHQVP